MSDDEFTKHERLVTVASFFDPMQAAMARNQLLSHGIRATIDGDTVASNFWYIRNAIGDIHLQVLATDLDRAAAALELTPESPMVDDPNGDLDSDQHAHDNPELDEIDDEVEAPLTARERNAVRACRGAVFGIVFMPLQFYVLWLTAQIVASEERLRSKYRTRTVIAAVLSVSILLCYSFIIHAIASGTSHGHAR